MKKFLIVLAFFVLFFSFGFASITNLTIPDEVPLNKTLTIYGVNDTANVLCAFYIFDMNDVNQAIIRLSDEYSFADGSFYSEYVVTEPLLRRGYDYNVVVKCGSNQADGNFYIQQKEDYLLGVSKDTITNEIAFWNDAENSVIMMFVVVIVLFVASILLVFKDRIF